MTTARALTMILTAALGTFGFALLFQTRKRMLPWAVLGGCLSTAVYVLCVHLFAHEFFQNLVPALFATAFAELLARLTKAPTTPYIACAIIPLVPGSALFLTMYHFILGEMEPFHTSLVQTLRISAGLAVGILCVSGVMQLFQRVKQRAKK